MPSNRTVSLLAAATIAAALAAGCEQKPAEPAASTPASHGSAAPASAPASGSGPIRTVAFELSGSEPVGALQYDVKVKGSGRFVGDSDGVACETKVEGALSTYNHIVDQKLLRAAFASVKGFSGPIVVSECKFQGEARVEDFEPIVRDSSGPELNQLDPPPTIKAVLR